MGSGKENNKPLIFNLIFISRVDTMFYEILLDSKDRDSELPMSDYNYFFPTDYDLGF